MSERFVTANGGELVHYSCPAGKSAIISGITIGASIATTATISLNGTPAFNISLTVGTHNLIYYTGKITIIENQSLSVSVPLGKITISVLETLSDNADANFITANHYVFDQKRGIITDYNSVDGAKSIGSIPTQINGVTVKDIGTYAFYTKGLSGTIVLPSTMTKIGAYTFANNSFNNSGLTIPSSVTTINTGAFQNNALGGTLTLSSALTSIGASAFQNNQLSGTLTIPASITGTNIGASAFRTNQFTKVVFQASSLTFNIYSYAFAGNSITEVDFSATSNLVIATGTSSNMSSYLFHECPITKIRMPANISLNSDGYQAFGSNNTAGFITAYTTTHSRAAGTYEYISGAWTKTA